MWILLGLVLGILIGILLPFRVPIPYAKYVAVSFIAGLDSILGASRSGFEGKFNFKVFISGFFFNAILAGILTFVGDRLGVDLYLAAIVTFGVRIFENSATLRRLFLQRLAPSGEKKEDKPSGESKLN